MSRHYNPWNWYWLASDGRIFASGSRSLIQETDPVYRNWVEGGGTPSIWPPDPDGAQTTASLQDVLMPYNIFVDLAAYAACARYARETAGITVGNAQIATDRGSQAMISGAYAYVQANPNATINFKTASGFVALTAAQITSIAMAVGAHVQACFAAEAQVDAGLNASPPTITTTAQVDAAFAAITA